LWRGAVRVRLQHHGNNEHTHHGGGVYEPGGCHVGPVAKPRPHERRVLFQRSQLDELSRPQLPHPLAISHVANLFPSFSGTSGFGVGQWYCSGLGEKTITRRAASHRGRSRNTGKCASANNKVGLRIRIPGPTPRRTATIAANTPKTASKRFRVLAVM